jgi:hypothetical protein
MNAAKIVLSGWDSGLETVRQWEGNSLKLSGIDEAG